MRMTAQRMVAALADDPWPRERPVEPPSRHQPVDDEWGRSECLDPDNVGDVADEGLGHRG